MNRVVLSDIRLGSNHFSGAAEWLRRVLLGLFLVHFALVWAGLWLPTPLFGDVNWPDGLLLVLAAAAALGALSRSLPAQNILLASSIIILISSAAYVLDSRTGIPFGPCQYTDRIRMRLGPLPWAMPLLWLVALLTSRNVARLALRPWRHKRDYGFWVIGATALLLVFFALGLEPFATQVRHYWSWNPTRLKLDWYDTPWVNFVGWAVTAVLILAFATPALINKKPARQPADLHSLGIWLLLNLLFATAAAVHQLWLAFSVILCGSLLLAILALRGAKRWHNHNHNSSHSSSQATR